MDMSTAHPPGSGHRLRARTAGLLVEAWAPDFGGCAGQTVTGLVESFADTSAAAASSTLPFTFEPDTERDLMVRLLDEALCLVEVFGVIPLHTTAYRTAEGGLDGEFDVVPTAQAQLTGPLPRGAQWLDCRCEREDAGWRCQVAVAHALR